MNGSGKGRWSAGGMVVVAAVGATLFGALVREVSPSVSLDMKFDRGEIMTRASAYLRSLGYELRDYQQDAWLAFDPLAHVYLQNREGLKAANSIIRADTLPIHTWSVVWYDRTVPRSRARETFSVTMSPGGKVLGYDHAIQDSLTCPSLAGTEARKRAEAFLRMQGIDLARYVLRTSSEVKLVNRLDHRFVWQQPDSTTESTIWVRVQGDELGGFGTTFRPGGAFRDTYASVETTMTFVIIASFAVMFLLFFFIVVLFLKKYHEGEVGIRGASLVLLGLLLVTFLTSLNEYPGIGVTAGIGDLNRYNVRIIVFVLNVFILQVFLAVLAFAAWSVGESSARSVWPAKLIGADSALARRFFTVDLGRGVLRGYAWGLTLLGIYTLIVALLLKAGGEVVVARGARGIPEAIFPSLHPIGNAFSTAAFGEIIFRLFFLSYLKEKTGRVWLGVVLSTLLWTLGAMSMWELPIGGTSLGVTMVVLAGFGLALCALFLRYDLVTSVTASFVMIAISDAIPFMAASGEHFRLAQWVFPLLMAIPPVAAVVGVTRGIRFVFPPETLPAHVQRISERVRMAKELEIARNVQLSLLPKDVPHLAGFDIGGVCLPAREVGGDYYDFIAMGGRRVGIAIGDVSGKGMPAAIYMTLTKGILQSHAGEDISPKTVLTKVNSLMYRTIERNSFVSMLYAVLDLDRRTIRFARAGQCPVILSQRASTPPEFLSPRGMALGLEMGKVFDAVLEEQEMPLRSGETLVFYTDGFTEAMTRQEDEFGEERLVESVRRHREKPALQLIHAVVEDVRAFTGDTPQHDDMTMVVVKIA